SQLLETQAQTKAQTAYSKYTAAQQSAEATFKKLAGLTPTDVTVQYQLGQAATAAGDYKSAIAAYQKFLKLSPTDVDAPQVRQLLQAVKAQAGLSAAGASSG
ncbi:MAG: tetratricopeptide repeat protein, partial [Actinobacteria bacterium]|nr:tetratricopeptide repeat protein [Actinomycetota bacterium]